LIEQTQLDLALNRRFGHGASSMAMILDGMITILISMFKPRKVVVGIVALLLALTACGDTPGEDDLQVVATTSIWGDVLSQVVGDAATVEVLIPRGADAHDYRPTSQQIAALLEADLVIANGLGLEQGLADVLESAAFDGAEVFEVAPELNPLLLSGHGHGDADEHDLGDLDPHVWFDLRRVDTASQLIAERLAAIDDSVDWAARAADYSADLLQTEEDIVRVLQSVPPDARKLVTNHEALGYFADRHGFEVIAVVIPGGSTLGDPSSAQLASLVEEIEQEGIRTIFAETTRATRLAEAVAAEVGEEVTVVELYTESLGEPGSGADTLISMLLTNARRIAEALAG
jgi:zinc/manganese transport system substrate-binding protein